MVADTARGHKIGRWLGSRRVRTALTLLFFGIVVALLVMNARDVEWRQVARAVGEYGATTLLGAAPLALAGHLIYTFYDLLGRSYARHGLSAPRVMSIAFVSYAFNLNLGPIIGAMAFRYRLYSRYGLRRGVITRVLGFSVVTNWLGYLLLAGVLFASRGMELPSGWALGAAALQALGIAMIVVVAVYLWLCARARRRTVSVRGFELELPPLGMGLLQLVVSCASWLTIAGVIFILLPAQVSFPTVLGVLLLAAIAAVATHIPAGLGVLEATFVLLLGHRLPASELLAALLVYRVLYYLAPLALALAVLLVLEAEARRLRSSSASSRKSIQRRT